MLLPLLSLLTLCAGAAAGPIALTVPAPVAVAPIGRTSPAVPARFVATFPTMITVPKPSRLVSNAIAIDAAVSGRREPTPRPDPVQVGGGEDWPEAKLDLNDGTSLSGLSIGADRSMAGEVVFYTGMAGYPETLTDPSYKGQILVFTYPLIGNYGVPPDHVLDDLGLPKYFESDTIHVAGVVLASYSHEYSHWSAGSSLSDWLKKHNIPAIAGLDTRLLTKRIRDQGTMLGKIVVNDVDIPFDDPNARNLIAEVSRTEPQTFGNGPIKIVAVDLGIKNNIIRYLARPDVTLTVVPWDYDFNDDDVDGVFLSNGPGDPVQAQATIEHVRRALQRDDVPIFGICMGHQIVALASGAQTYKMKFGNRGMNQPVIDLRNLRAYMTSQNHGYAVIDESLPDDFIPMFRNANDHSNEGIQHTNKAVFSVQFHPEGAGGPTDTSFLFDDFLSYVKSKKAPLCALQTTDTITIDEPKAAAVRKVLILGSGGLSIGQAGEFDYSGSQAIKALHEMDVDVILVNPNIATVQTSDGMADQVYFVAVTADSVADIIAKERPDALLLQFGGQTALNCGLQLDERGVLQRYGVRVLGTSIDTIRASEDRRLFADRLAEIGEPVAPSRTCTDVNDALRIADALGYPVLVRAAFALGGLGSGFADTPAALADLVRGALASSPQVIIDKSLRGWKEVEYEMVRDRDDNCVAVCNMENFDPVGVHTGDSIVVAPSQTLSNREYYRLRQAAIRIVRHFEIVGECNVQFALDPDSEQYYVIEMNARLSRSSALASKATGYPLAYVACKIAMGLTLTQIRNSVTQTTTACFEPSLDYVVVKMPRWDLGKFDHVTHEIGSSMKSVGEVMSIGRTFEEAFQKGVRMVDGDLDGFGHVPDDVGALSGSQLDDLLRNPTDRRLLHLAAAFRRGYTIEQIHNQTRIDCFFLFKLQNVMRLGASLSCMTPARILEAKQAGFSDRQIARCCGVREQEVRQYRCAHGIRPFVKQIDTLAAEFPAVTNYLYMTYNAAEHDVEFDSQGVMVLGCGAYRIGSSCEFDWSAVSCLRALQQLEKPSILVNFNPETVSTDYDECDRLYFEELSLERVLDIYECEASQGVIVSVGGQIANNLALSLHHHGVHIFGTHPTSIDMAEDRFKFSALLDSIGVDQPEWAQLTTVDDAIKFADQVGYPVLVRPSYVLSGAAMNVAQSPDDLLEFLAAASAVAPNSPVVVSKFLERAQEIEMDAVARNGVVINYAISEHVEDAGVHSGDATLLLPAQTLSANMIQAVKSAGDKIAHALHITGPFNVQFLSPDDQLKVIECNLRASRSFPFVSKTFGANFIELATKAMVGCDVAGHPIDPDALDFVCCKAPMFSFMRLHGADPVLGVEMASTGEVACFGSDRHEAFLNALLATGFKIPIRSVLFSCRNPAARLEFLESARVLAEAGFRIFATTGTAQFLQQNGVDVIAAFKPGSEFHPNVVDLIKLGEIGLVINIPDSAYRQQITDGYHIRRAAVDSSVALITNMKQAVLLVESLVKVKDISLKAWKEYLLPE